MGLFTSFILNYFVMVLENLIMFVIIECRVFNYIWCVDFGF